MIVAAVAFLVIASSGHANGRYPGTHWAQLPAAERAEWSPTGLRDVATCLRFMDTSALMIVWHGAIVFQSGDVRRKFMVHSMRKSLLNPLIGLAVQDGKIRLGDTLAHLGIDDHPDPLTPEEKLATVRDLLQSRSGIYHPAALETPDMTVGRPSRGIHPPGSFWLYNNWDFNVLGTIYEHQSGEKIFDSFYTRIASKIGMEDFQVTDGDYQFGPESIFPGYPMRMSTRDLARFGLFYLHKGRWGSERVIPADWMGQAPPHIRTRARQVATVTSFGS